MGLIDLVNGLEWRNLLAQGDTQWGNFQEASLAETDNMVGQLALVVIIHGATGLDAGYSLNIQVVETDEAGQSRKNVEGAVLSLAETGDASDHNGLHVIPVKNWQGKYLGFDATAQTAGTSNNPSVDMTVYLVGQKEKV